MREKTEGKDLIGIAISMLNFLILKSSLVNYLISNNSSIITNIKSL